MRMFNELAASDELRMDYMLQPGDIQVLCNHTQLHTRQAFVDHEVSPAGDSCARVLLRPVPSLQRIRTFSAIAVDDRPS